MNIPQTLIEEIQQYYSGGYLWIDRKNYKKRNQEIVNLKAQGVSALEIAKRMNLTSRRVCQILKTSSVQEKWN